MGFLASTPASPSRVWDLTGRVLANAAVCSGLWRLDLALPLEVSFQPGQFAMLNPCRSYNVTFRRPFSIMAGDGACLSFLYRVVGRGTACMAALQPGESVDCLAPLGRPFPVSDAPRPPVLLVAGGVGLPPLYAWLARHGRPGDMACFGGRHGADVPWSMVPDPWMVSVDQFEAIPSGRSAYHGRVTELVQNLLAAETEPALRLVLACGPLPMLKTTSSLARERRWPCHVSVEEHMGCGYGVCKGCVVPVWTAQQDGWRHANCCTEGPVFDAADLNWDRFTACVEEPA